MQNHFFQGYDGIPRSVKPRTKGLTMVANFGVGPRALQDLLEIGGDYFDFLKIAVGLSRLYPKAILAEAIRLAQERDIESFPGGQFLEYAEIGGKAEGYFDACIEAGYRWVEVSDNLASVSLEWKGRMIRGARKAGLRVLGEVGKKEGLETTADLAEDASVCVDAGAEIILLEAAEMVGDDAETARLVQGVVDAVGLEKVMFELPGPWIAGVHLCDVHAMQSRLIAQFGSEVSIGNVMPSELMKLEAYRRGLGVNAGSRMGLDDTAV